MRDLKVRRTFRRSTSGQSLVEFALVGVILFLTITGIMEAGRLLFAYSVVSNAAQEGSRYAIVRPRDVVSSSEATQVAPPAGTPTYIPEQVVPDGTCNIFSKAREKVWSVPQADVQVSVWYDTGDGTPIVVSDDVNQPNYVENIVKS